MAKLTRQAVLQPQIRETALSLIGGPWASNKKGFVETVENWLRTNVILVDEAEELIQTPLHLLSMIKTRGFVYGDCDDAASLGASLISVIGIPVRFVALRPRSSPIFVHVYVEAETNGRYWQRMDPTIAPGRGYNPTDERMVVEV